MPMPPTPSPRTTGSLIPLANQTESAKEQAISAWHQMASSSPMDPNIPCPSCALLAPLNGKPMPVVKGTSGGSRHASATPIHFIIGHTFIGSYTPRFHLRKCTSCPGCGANPQLLRKPSTQGVSPPGVDSYYC